MQASLFLHPQSGLRHPAAFPRMRVPHINPDSLLEPLGGEFSVMKRRSGPHGVARPPTLGQAPATVPGSYGQPLATTSIPGPTKAVHASGSATGVVAPLSPRSTASPGASSSGSSTRTSPPRGILKTSGTSGNSPEAAIASASRNVGVVHGSSGSKRVRFIVVCGGAAGDVVLCVSNLQPRVPCTVGGGT